MMGVRMDFRAVEANLRQSFRVLASGRARSEVAELPGVSIASLGVQFQMFNAAFLSAPVGGAEELEARLGAAREHFAARREAWAFWCCEDWLAAGARRKLVQSCQQAGLRLCAEMPGMAAARLREPKHALPELDYRRVSALRELEDFRGIGATCFRVPPGWFGEVFDPDMARRPEFVCWVGYAEGEPVVTAATVRAPGNVIGVYNVATTPGHRGRGCGEAVTRHAIEAARRDGRGGEDDCVILQSTTLGYALYRRMGFRDATRIAVFSSEPAAGRV